MAGLFNSAIGGMHQVLDLRSQQNAMTASNLANANTPGYRAKHLDFEEALGDAMNQGDRLAMQVTDRRHMDVGGAMSPDVVELDPTPWSEDGNSVLPEREMARLQENALMYRAVSSGLSKKLAMLKYAASDGRG